MLQPALYSANSNVVSQNIKFIVDKYKHLIKWKNNSNIFEFGVGDGRTCAEVLFPRLYPADYRKYVGTDQSSVMLRHAKKLLSCMNTEFFELDIFKDAPSKLFDKFDVVVSSLTLHWGVDTRKAVDNIYKMLKPGGQTFNITFTETPIDETYEKLSENPKWHNFDHKILLSPYYKNLDAAEMYKKQFIEGGFKDCVVFSEDYVYEFCNKKEYEDLYFALNPIASTISEDYRKEYCKHYFNALLNSRLWSVRKSQTGEEVVTVIFKLCLMYGTKHTA